MTQSEKIVLSITKGDYVAAEDTVKQALYDTIASRQDDIRRDVADHFFNEKTVDDVADVDNVDDCETD